MLEIRQKKYRNVNRNAKRMTARMAHTRKGLVLRSVASEDAAIRGWDFELIENSDLWCLPQSTRKRTLCTMRPLASIQDTFVLVRGRTASHDSGCKRMAINELTSSSGRLSRRWRKSKRTYQRATGGFRRGLSALGNASRLGQHAGAHHASPIDWKHGT